MSGIGHNKGPSMERGHTWRTYQWKQAQKALTPKSIPLMVVKMRVRRARELGMDYKTYASLRQATGRDICGFLFSSNALDIIGAGVCRMPPMKAAKLQAIHQAQRLALVHLPVDPQQVLSAEEALDDVARAPDVFQSWSQTRDSLIGFVRERRLCGDQVVVVGDTALEAEWTTAARAAGYISAEKYFGAAG